MVNARAGRVFRPPRTWNLLYGLGTAWALVVLGGLVWKIWRSAGGPDFALWLGLTALSAFLVPWLAYGWWWTRRVYYRLEPTALVLTVPGAQAYLPLEDIAWAGVAEHYDRPLPPAPRAWPGLLVGFVVQADGTTVAFYGLRRARRVVIEDTEGRVLVLTPAAVGDFLAALRAYLEPETPAEEEVAAAANAVASAGPPGPQPLAPPAAATEAAVPSAPPAAAKPRGGRRAAWALIGLAWLLAVAVTAWAYLRWPRLPLGLQYALYGHWVVLGGETGLGYYLAGARRLAYAYALWAAGLLAGAGLAWAFWVHGA